VLNCDDKSNEPKTHRAEQIHAFKREIASLKAAGILNLTKSQLNSINLYQQLELKKNNHPQDQQLTKKSKQLTLGMKIASFFGAITMSTSLFFLFCQFFWDFNLYSQLFVLVLTPLILTTASLFLVKHDKIYYAKITATVALVSFALNLSLVVNILNLPVTPNIAVPLSLLGFLLAYACTSRLILTMAIITASTFFVFKIGFWNGYYWDYIGNNLEILFTPSVILLLFCKLVPQNRFIGFDAVYNSISLVILFITILFLSNWGEGSYISLAPGAIEVFYQILGLFISILAIWHGVNHSKKEFVNIGSAFLFILIYLRVFDFFWGWMPRFLFFFVIGIISLLFIFIFKRLQSENTGIEAST
jgi:hypothetical protein